MKLIYCLVVLTILTSCGIDKNKKSVSIDKPEPTEISIHEQLRTYIDKHRITPSITVNNSEGNQTDIQLSNHKIKWINTENEIKIEIDNDIFSIMDKITLNNVQDSEDSVNFANNWDEIKLYKYDDREIVGIRMLNAPCTGIGCSVNYYLIYDLKTKTKNFFGTFRTDNELALYDFRKDGKVDYLSKSFIGDAQGSTQMKFIYELFSMQPNGQFKQQKDTNGKAYQIIQTTFPEDTTKTDLFEQDWIEKITTR
jgi:hypothetical protein